MSREDKEVFLDEFYMFLTKVAKPEQLRKENHLVNEEDHMPICYLACHIEAVGEKDSWVIKLTYQRNEKKKVKYLKPQDESFDVVQNILQTSGYSSYPSRAEAYLNFIMDEILVEDDIFKLI